MRLVISILICTVLFGCDSNNFSKIELYNTPQNLDHWLSLKNNFKFTVDYENKQKKIFSGI